MKLNKLTGIFALTMLCAMPLGLASCGDDDEFSTQQFVGGVNLNSFGPSPVARGGELRFIGSGMDQIQSIEIPGCGAISDIKVISSEEIRITVPQEAEPGYLTLKYANGTIVTKTELTYTEPISFDSFSPSSIKPGSSLTIKGDYLNLIGEIIFSDGVYVPAEEFTSQSRAQIVVTVPAEAQTGLIIISDAAEEMPNWIYSEEELVVTLPSVESVQDLSAAKPGQTCTFTVKDIDLVVSVEMPNGDEVEFTIDGDKLSFILPDNVTGGTICMLPASGVKVAIATIDVAVPEDVVADPASDIWAGQTIKFKGVNMELVETVTFPGIDAAVEPESKSSTEITVVVPEGAQSGEAILTTGSGATVSVEVSTLKPEAIGYNPCPAALASVVAVTGRNLQYVTVITFDEATSVEVANPTDTGFEITIPATLNAGINAVTLTLSNGEVVEVESLELTAPECAYATVLPDEEEEIYAGGVFSITIANGEMLTGVLVNGQSVQYILTGTTLYIQVPETCGKTATVTLVSSNGEISYDINVIPQTYVGMTIWSGIWDCGFWGGNQDLAWGGFDWSTVPAGATLTLYTSEGGLASPYDGWWCISLRHGNGWGNLAGAESQYDTPEDGILSVTLTQEMLDDLVNEGGLVITGCYYILTKVMVEWEVSLETTVPFSWNGTPQDLGSWSLNLECGPGSALIDAGVKVGQTMRIYLTVYDDYPMIQVYDGHWNALSLPEAGGGNQFNPDNCADMSCIEIAVTQDLYERFTTYTDWGYCLIFNGSGVIVNKVTLQ